MAPEPETQPKPETPADPTLDNCPDCHVRPGRFHLHGCDVARCAFTGLQRAGCVHGIDVCNTRWTGQWLGEAECLEYGFVIKFVLVQLGDVHEVALCGPPTHAQDSLVGAESAVGHFDIQASQERRQGKTDDLFRLNDILGCCGRWQGPRLGYGSQCLDNLIVSHRLRLSIQSGGGYPFE
ncbi:hypothetical protein [Streptomyces sp. NBC_01800]|uniref:hypothetical protein n=1 Tax=Streptomyces sp. NBC_01800 TaxID=2975945 RepID=UPI002DDB3C0D|nr:hypothetical protein [Streptomyces sp. NBC_01800]WSA68845.1 hypothetical protein OIE65_18665 [Streptomyces sp. NBC_01800]